MNYFGCSYKMNPKRKLKLKNKITENFEVFRLILDDIIDSRIQFSSTRKIIRKNTNHREYNYDIKYEPFVGNVLYIKCTREQFKNINNDISNLKNTII